MLAGHQLHMHAWKLERELRAASSIYLPFIKAKASKKYPCLWLGEVCMILFYSHVLSASFLGIACSPGPMQCNGWRLFWGCYGYLAPPLPCSPSCCIVQYCHASAALHRALLRANGTMVGVWWTTKEIFTLARESMGMDCDRMHWSEVKDCYHGLHWLLRSPWHNIWLNKKSLLPCLYKIKCGSSIFDKIHWLLIWSSITKISWVFKKLMHVQ